MFDVLYYRRHALYNEVKITYNYVNEQKNKKFLNFNSKKCWLSLDCWDTIKNRRTSTIKWRIRWKKFFSLTKVVFAEFSTKVKVQSLLGLMLRTKMGTQIPAWIHSFLSKIMSKFIYKSNYLVFNVIKTWLYFAKH